MMRDDQTIPLPAARCGFVAHTSFRTQKRAHFICSRRKGPPEETVWDTPARSFSAYQGGEVPRGLGRGHRLGWIKPDLGAYCESENRMYCVP